MVHRVGVIAGDGIGPAVVADALKVVRAAGVAIEEVAFDLGADRYARDGHVLDDDDLEGIRSCDAILKGPLGPPIGDTVVPPGTVERGIILRLRFALDQYVNLRPFASKERDLDFVVVRENTEGSYAGEGGFLRKGTAHEIATQGSVNTRMGVERCVRYAFELAESRSRRHLTLVHKTNVLTFAGDLWQRVFDAVAAEHPDVTTAYNHVDAACIYLVEDPGRYDVIVTDNLFGDILTDLAGAVTGGVGFAGTGNLNPDRTAPSMFEPVHGSAHDSVGTDRVNPSSQILSAVMMLEFLGEADAAARIRKALDDVIASDPVPTTIGDLVAGRL
ncbi:MAG TPA: 3-isopropylmalate dehydrogenase [Acidimicrobiales bacterium]|nr:3-isopropylmalate dehydrogenase [Acidimicrobiales bacterium]